MMTLRHAMDLLDALPTDTFQLALVIGGLAVWGAIDILVKVGSIVHAEYHDRQRLRIMRRHHAARRAQLPLQAQLQQCQRQERMFWNAITTGRKPSA